MNFEQCLEYLKRLGNEVHGMKFGLETTHALMAELDSPHRKFPSVLIAGTNGKGSVARMLHSICYAAGMRTGLYTSPHLVRIEERIQVDGSFISRDDFARSFSEIVRAARTRALNPTFFELLTCTAFAYFAQMKVELAVLEVGMGGRLDSTNVVDPLLSILTPIGIDHKNFLGDTLGQIAREKAGIMRESKLTLSAHQTSEVAGHLLQMASQKDAHLEFLDSEKISVRNSTGRRPAFQFREFDIQLGIPGKVQVQNACLSIEAAHALRRQGLPISDTAILDALTTLQLPAVLQILREDPILVVDGGHNRGAAVALSDFVERFTPPPRTLVFGIMKDKEIAEVMACLRPLFDRIHLTRVDSNRAASIDELTAICPEGIPSPELSVVFEKVVARAETAIIAGSFYLAGEFLKFLEASKFPTK